MGVASGACSAISRENPRNFGKTRLARVNIPPQSPWDPAAMARHRKPAVVRKLEGNPGKRKIVDDLPGLGKPVIPAHLSLDEQACWRAVVRSLPEGILTSADTQCIERMSVAWSTYRQCAAIIREGAVLVKRPRLKTDEESRLFGDASGRGGNGVVRLGARALTLFRNADPAARPARMTTTRWRFSSARAAAPG